MSELYQVCMRGTRAHSITWNASAGQFNNTEQEEEIRAFSPEDAATDYVERFLCCGDISGLFEDYGGDHGGDKAVIETWVREHPEGDYWEGEWRKVNVFIDAIVEYNIAT